LTSVDDVPLLRQMPCLWPFCLLILPIERK